MGSLAYLLSNLPLGIFWFTLLLTLILVGISTAIIWVGLGISALAVLVWRAGAQFERIRSHGLLHAPIASPYHPLPAAGQKQRWKSRLRASSTWRDLAYLLLLCPIGIIEFTLVVTFWSIALAMIALPIYYRFLPGGVYHFPSSANGPQWITVDSTLSALPWTGLGLLVLVVAIVTTKALATAHLRLAQALLGPPADHPSIATPTAAPAQPTSAVSGQQTTPTSHTPQPPTVQ